MSLLEAKPRIRTIALEEAFMHPKLFDLYPSSMQRDYSFLKSRLTAVGIERIRHMDAAGIDLEVLSHVQPGVQLIEEPNQAISLAEEINDWLAEAISKYPTRLAGFATLPTQAPKAAAEELERAVVQLGLKGALINGHTNGRYLDHESFSVLLERAQSLDVPIYIHPTDPPKTVTHVYYPDYPNLVTGWGWSVETGTHVLRMMAGGVFDRYPRLKIIIGHMGELIPYCLTRLNVALTMGSWLLDSRGMEKNVSYYSTFAAL
jgi:predicted TIM-barrel fold metal-dependent hydrolase